MSFLGRQQKSGALVLTSCPSKLLLEFLGGPFRLWSEKPKILDDTLVENH